MDFKTRTQIIYEKLKEAIILGKYKPGEKIVISKIARKYDVSEIPVREVFAKLKSEGYISTKPHVGSRVTEYDLDKIEKIYQVRWELEGLAANLAAQHMDKKTIKELENIIRKMQNVIDKREYEKVGLLNKKFHKTIYSKCGNDFLYDLIDDLWNITRRTPGVFNLCHERTKKAAYDHKVILEAIKEGNGELAKNLTIEQKKISLSIMQNYCKENIKETI